MKKRTKILTGFNGKINRVETHYRIIIFNLHGSSINCFIRMTFSNDQVTDKSHLIFTHFRYRLLAKNDRYKISFFYYYHKKRNPIFIVYISWNSTKRYSMLLNPNMPAPIWQKKKRRIKNVLKKSLLSKKSYWISWFNNKGGKWKLVKFNRLLYTGHLIKGQRLLLIYVC